MNPLALLALLALPALALAQSGEPGAAEGAGAGEAGGTSAAAPVQGRSPWSLSITALGQHTFSAAVDGEGGSDAGDVSITRASTAVNVGYAATDSLFLSLGVTPEFSWYDFDEDTFGTDSLNTYEVGFTPALAYRLDETWSFRVAGLFDTASETGETGNSWTFGAIGTVRYAFSPTFALTGGLLVTSQLEDNVLVIPIVGVEWQISERVRLESRGLGLDLIVDLTDDLSLTVGAAYESRAFRLKDIGPIDEPILRDRRVPVTVQLGWTPHRNVELFVRGGAVVWQEFRLDDEDGDEITESNTDPAGFIGGGATIRF
jgi:hypothetical protein